MTTAVMSLIDSDNYKSKLFGDDTNSFRSVSPTSSINKQSYSTSPISLKLLSKKRFRDEEDMFADIIRIESSTEISDQGITSTTLCFVINNLTLILYSLL